MYLFVSASYHFDREAETELLQYLQGGRLVTERKMVSDMYTFDLETFTWEKMMPPPEDNIPGPRYFHSADVCECSL